MKLNRSHAPVRTLTRVLFLATIAFTSVAPARQKSVLDDHYVLDRIRVFYTREGKSAVSRADADQSGVPDQVENVAKQIWAAHRLFCEVLKFPDPFESERYRGATCIQVFIRERNEMGGGNGTAFESAQRAREIPEGKPEDRALVMAIGSHVDPMKNVTPAHELFHLIQYGATFFKNRWYLEGQARWSEHGLARGGIGAVKYPPKGPWPQSTRHLRQLMSLSYDAEFMVWNPVAVRADQKGLLTEAMRDEKLVALKYSDGSPVVRDPYLQGAAVMRDILIELGRQDDVAFKELAYKTWTEDHQRSEQNNPYIYRAIMDALRRHAPPVGAY